MVRSIPVIDFSDYTSGDQSRREKFVKHVGDSLKDIGFFALSNHGIPLDLINKSYDMGDEFFGLTQDKKMNYARREYPINAATLHLVLSMQKTIQHQI